VKTTSELPDAVTALRLIGLSLIVTTFFHVVFMPKSAASPNGMPQNSWRELANPRSLKPVNGAYYYEFRLASGSSAQLVVACLKEGRWRVRPFLCEKTTATSAIARAQSASAAINGGYFNLSDGASASYVILDGKLAANPHENRALVENPRLQPFMTQILNRSELRILKPQSPEAVPDIEIARHDDPLPAGRELMDALQAGPRLLPVLDCEEEAFLRKQADGSTADSIGCLKAAARSAFGLTADGYAIFLTVSDRAHDSESCGITLADLADLMKRLGCRQAINLDGGSSTSLYVRLAEDPAHPAGLSVCGRSPETLVKTVLMLLPR
jgi:hypothetical protein